MSSNDVAPPGASGDTADDALAALLSTSSFAVTKRENDVNREHPRFARYKNKSETSNAQERRRREVLSHQKKRREDYLAFARNLAEGTTRKEDEMDEVIMSRNLLDTNIEFHFTDCIPWRIRLSSTLGEKFRISPRANHTQPRNGIRIPALVEYVLSTRK